MIVDDRTPHLNLPLPHETNELDTDVIRIRAAFTSVDTAVKALNDGVAGLRTDLTAIQDEVLLLLQPIEASVASLQASMGSANTKIAGLETQVAAHAALRGAANGLATLDANALVPLTQLPALPAAKVTTGTFDIARIPGLGADKVTSGTFDVARIPALDASKVTSGVFDAARIPALATSKISGLDGALAGKFPTAGGTMGGSLTVQGNIYATGDVTAFSDRRLKSNIETIEGALQKVLALRGVTYDREGARRLGVIAQEVLEVVPEAVVDNGQHLAVAYGNLVGLLIEAVKELAGRAGVVPAA